MSQEKYRVLISNDDGIYAPGLEALVQELARYPSRYEVKVSCPNQEQSAKSHAVSLGPLYVDRYTFKECPGVQAMMVSGTPADSVRVGLASDLLGGWVPHIVVSGINRGSNTGLNSVYSGTVAAAMEANVYDVPSIALSLQDHRAHAIGDYILAAECAVQLLWEVLQGAPGPVYCLNVNFPSCPRDELQGWRVTTQDRSRWIGKYTRREATDDERSANPQRVHLALGGHLKIDGESLSNDTVAMQANWISVTPLHMSFVEPAEHVGKIASLPLFQGPREGE